MITADDVERVIEGAPQVQREDAGFREHIASERLGAPPGSGITESDDDRREDE
jgi:hypothetical protein